jgi:hypothetical protein
MIGSTVPPDSPAAGKEGLRNALARRRRCAFSSVIADIRRVVPAFTCVHEVRYRQGLVPRAPTRASHAVLIQLCALAAECAAAGMAGEGDRCAMPLANNCATLPSLSLLRRRQSVTRSRGLSRRRIALPLVRIQWSSAPDEASRLPGAKHVETFDQRCRDSRSHRQAAPTLSALVGGVAVA